MSVHFAEFSISRKIFCTDTFGANATFATSSIKGAFVSRRTCSSNCMRIYLLFQDGLSMQALLYNKNHLHYMMFTLHKCHRHILANKNKMH